MAKIDQFLRLMQQQKASDLHLTVGSVPVMRVHGQLTRVKFRELTQSDLKTLMYEIMSDEKKRVFEDTHDVDFAYEIAGLARFRVNLFMQRKGMGAALRTIPETILTADQLGLPEVVRKLCQLNKGLVLVTGPAGSGKSTTLAAMIDLINETRAEHILTIEDPVEFTHANKKGLVNQREVGGNTRSFATALRAALREDPDVLLVGEMRDPETIALGLTAAETGHLVFGSLHTSSAPKTIDRIINRFPASEQEQIRAMLGETLRGVIAQQLPRKADGGGRVAAFEILIVTPAISNLIREGKTHQIAGMMQTGRKDGMVTMDQSLLTLLGSGTITPEDAYAKGQDKSAFLEYLKGEPPPTV
ncbi:MAG TPA: type IV pilus twitching motility protein PilT [Longimicrobiales bacterium]|nr:type IV pilus twitching motility protein PilT [Longimicrobiales bacterium]